MQEEVENKSVAISIKATKLTANVLKAALLKALAEMEKKMIQQALQEEEGNQTKAAIRLGIDRSTLYRKISKML